MTAATGLPLTFDDEPLAKLLYARQHLREAALDLAHPEVLRPVGSSCHDENPTCPLARRIRPMGWWVSE